MWRPDLSDRSGPKYLQIVEAIAADIAAGRLAPGTRLPPHRELAYRLDISPNTTARAYAEAVKRALAKGEVGRGTFVRSTDGHLPTDEPETLRRPAAGPIDLSRNLPMPGFSEPHIRRVLGVLANGSGLPALLDDQTDADLEHHREAGRTWLASCGLDFDLDGVVATMGGQHGVLCALMALAQPGDLLLTEALTYTPVVTMAARLGLRTASVAMDRGGVMPDAFEALCRTANPKAFYLTPTLQAPTTITLSSARRTKIAEIAGRYGVILIEDDVFGPLKNDKPAPIARSARDHTIYVTSLSKAVAPGLRVGFLHAPKRFAPALRQSVNLSVWMTPPMALEVASRLIADGTARRLADQQRRTARRRQGLVGRSLGTESGAGSADGYHVWLPLPDGWRADAFRSECARLGVLVSEGRSFAPKASDAPEAIRICISHEPSEDRLRRGLETIAGVLDMRPSGSSVAI